MLATVATHPQTHLILASNEQRARTQTKRMNMCDHAMGEVYPTLTAKEADKHASAVINGLRRGKPVGKRHAKREAEDLVYPNVHFVLGGVKQRKGAKQPLKGVRMKLSGKRTAVWKLGNGTGNSKPSSDLLKRQRVDDIAACALRKMVERSKGRADREEDVHSEDEGEEQYEDSLHNKKLQKELGSLFDILRAADMDAEADLKRIF